MLKAPKNKSELISALKDEKDFSVLQIQHGRAADLARELTKVGSGKNILLIVIQST